MPTAAASASSSSGYRSPTTQNGIRNEVHAPRNFIVVFTVTIVVLLAVASLSSYAVSKQTGNQAATGPTTLGGKIPLIAENLSAIPTQPGASQLQAITEDMGGITSTQQGLWNGWENSTLSAGQFTNDSQAIIDAIDQLIGIAENGGNSSGQLSTCYDNLTSSLNAMIQVYQAEVSYAKAGSGGTSLASVQSMTPSEISTALTLIVQGFQEPNTLCANSG